MQVAKDSVVLFHYRLYLEDSQEAFQDSFNNEPVAALIGAGNIIPGVEEAMMGQEAGAELDVTIPPEKGYGPRNPELFMRLPKKYFQQPAKLKPGMVTTLQTKEGPRQVIVVKIGMSVVDVDANPILAGTTLRFEMKIVEVRESTETERQHGHAHGPGGHEHG
ncbi:MAG: peptidylprolyl isomerase [Xanthomonadales bacterium]|nr:peptidylprolyl isomerase [Xanthomonadales bacterium]MCB1629162.1 peptidylprolyl isomerase [Xanthomonadales bacterium]MCB1636795.1 peptidylprolyl isomerase [Xanthomonadales bacterium]MCB1643647.1 peptidylprolyl isomerase [Xanthomonadales bacterium]